MRNIPAFRRVVLSVTGLVLTVLIVYAAYWEYTAGLLRDRLQRWAEARAAAGYLLRWDKATVGGFPGAFRLDFTNLSVGAMRPLPIAMNATVASAWSMPWNLHHWDFSAPDGARLVEPTGSVGFDVHRLGGAIDLEPTMTALDLTALDLAGIGLAQGVGIGDLEAHIELPARPPQSHTGTALTVAVQVNNATLPKAIPGFGHRLSGLSFAAQVKGVLPPGPLDRALAEWRDAGGTVELKSVRLRWGSLLVDASGTLALDRALQPEGAFSAMITGENEAVDVAVMTGTLKPDEAAAAKEVLALLSKTDAGGRKVITLPITIENRALFLGPARIAKLPPIPWH